MARICKGCGMVLGRDCFNEIDCMNISRYDENKKISTYQEYIEYIEQSILTMLEANLRFSYA